MINKPKVFINLPVRDLKKSMDFYAKIGFVNNANFTDETAASMVYKEDVVVMLLTHQKFSDFTHKPIADPLTSTAVILSLPLEGKDEVDLFITSALNAGAKEHVEAKDYGFMFLRSFEDLDGHQWEVFNMDENAMPNNS